MYLHPKSQGKEGAFVPREHILSTQREKREDVRGGMGGITREGRPKAEYLLKKRRLSMARGSDKEMEDVKQTGSELGNNTTGTITRPREEGKNPYF